MRIRSENVPLDSVREADFLIVPSRAICHAERSEASRRVRRPSGRFADAQRDMLPGYLKNSASPREEELASAEAAQCLSACEPSVLNCRFDRVARLPYRGGDVVPLVRDRHGTVVREAAPARFVLAIPGRPSEHLPLRVARTRDLRRQVLAPH